jgi:hypothetical protein
MRKLLPLLAASTALAFSAPASAAILLDLSPVAKQSATNQSFTFTATDALTTLNFQGYDIPGTISLVNLFFATTGTSLSTANNLLAGATFTATASGCTAPFNTFGTGSTGSYGAKDLTFGGTCSGLYDTLSTSVNTNVGQSYTLSFRLSNSAAGDTGLRISTGALSVGTVPEPATWAMILLGFGGIGFAMRRNRMLKPQAA